MLSKIREYLSVGLALIASLSVGVSIILVLRNDALIEQNKTLMSSNSQLVDVNVQAGKAIDKLAKQLEINDKIFKIIDGKLKDMAQSSVHVRNELKELKENDTEFKELLRLKHPVDINSLLNSRTGSSANGNGSYKTTE